MVGWVDRLTSCHSKIAAHLIKALALHLKAKLLPSNTAVYQWRQNAMADILSHLFGSVPQWHFETDLVLHTLFNNTFPLPNQKSWTVFCPSSKLAVCMWFLSCGRDILRWMIGGDYHWQGIMSEKLTCLSHAFGHGSLFTGIPIRHAQPNPHGGYAMGQRRILWTRIHSTCWNSMYGNCRNRADNCLGPWRKCTNLVGSTKFLLHLQQCIDGWWKQDPVSHKKLPIEADVPEYLVKCGQDPTT